MIIRPRIPAHSSSVWIWTVCAEMKRTLFNLIEGYPEILQIILVNGKQNSDTWKEWIVLLGMEVNLT